MFRTANLCPLPSTRGTIPELVGAVSVLVGTPVFGRRIIARDIRFGEGMTARLFNKRGDFAIGLPGVAQLLDLVAYHVDEGGDREPFLAQAQRIACAFARAKLREA